MGFPRISAWLRGGAGPMKDRRLKRTSRGADDAEAIEESLEGDANPDRKLPDGWVEGTAEELLGLEPGELDK